MVIVGSNDKCIDKVGRENIGDYDDNNSACDNGNNDAGDSCGNVGDDHSNTVL